MSGFLLSAEAFYPASLVHLVLSWFKPFRRLQIHASNPLGAVNLGGNHVVVDINECLPSVKISWIQTVRSHAQRESWIIALVRLKSNSENACRHLCLSEIEPNRTNPRPITGTHMSYLLCAHGLITYLMLSVLRAQL